MGVMHRATSAAMMDLYGLPVYKQGDLASDPDNLFTVTGMIEIVRLIGVVEVVVATTTTMLIEVETGTLPLFSATTITTDAVGTLYLYGGDTGAILNGGDAPAVAIGSQANVPLNTTIIGYPGATNNLRMQLDGAGTGKIGWYLWYKPMVIPGSPSTVAKVVAAA